MVETKNSKVIFISFLICIYFFLPIIFALVGITALSYFYPLEQDEEIPKNYIDKEIIQDTLSIDATTIIKYTYEEIDTKELLDKDFVPVLNNQEEIREKIYRVKQELHFYDIKISLEDYYKITQDIEERNHHSYTMYYYDKENKFLYYIHDDN